MDPLSLDQHSPKAFILAANGQSSPFQPEQDQVWSLVFDRSKGHLFHLHTTYSLRAKAMQVFPNILFGQRSHWNTIGVKQPPIITCYTPTFLQISYRLQNNTAVQFECFVPAVDTLVGSIQCHNESLDLTELTLELAALLVPMGKGIPTKPEKIGINQIIAGRTEMLFPVLFMSSGPKAITNPCPALSLSLKIEPGETQGTTWALVTKGSQTESFTAAQKVVATPWRAAAQQQVMKYDRQTIHIHTGNPDWDAAFFLAQTNAMTHLVSKAQDNSVPDFLRTRLPDQPPTNRTNLDHFNDITLLETQHLAQVQLPAHVETLAALGQQFVDRIDKDGRLVSRQNIPDFVPSYRECPILAHLCLEIYEINRDKVFLRGVFPKLCQLTDTWLSPPYDFESEYSLCWDSPLQLQLDTGLFTFDIWDPAGRGLDIHVVESPALAAMLHRESRALSKISEILEDKSAQEHFTTLTKSLKKKIQAFWQGEKQGFSYLDRQSHRCPSRELYYPGPAQKTLEFKKLFTSPQRLQCHLFSNDESTRVCHIQFVGKNLEGERIKETFHNRDILWVSGHAHLTTQHLYNSLDSVTIEGLQPEDHILIETADLSQCDITCLAPLWSGAMQKEQVRAFLENNLHWEDPTLSTGIPETWVCIHDLPDNLPIRVNVLWNTMIIKGLSNEGFTELAMQLFTNLMSGIVTGLQHYEGFFPFYDQESGRPAGGRNAIGGLVPVQLFLQIAGIRLFSPNRVALWGTNPFPWPIEVRWQGLALRRDGSNIHISFPDGATYQSNSSTPVLLTPGGLTA